MTTNEEVRNALLRLHGFNLMGHILKEYPNDIRIITLVRCPRSAVSEGLGADLLSTFFRTSRSSAAGRSRFATKWKTRRLRKV